jgi:hypothetical protein
MVAKLRNQHDQFRELAAGLKILLRGRTPANPDVLAAGRWRLTRLLLQHLSAEERTIYRPLERDPRPEIAVLAHSFKCELDAAFARLEEHIDLWTRARIDADWRGYAIATGHMIDFWLERMDREEAQLFHLVNPKADINVRTPGDRNWAAGGWAIRQKIEEAA